MFKMLVLL